MGQRSRKRREPRDPSAMKRGYARSEARNEEIRQSLEPLAPGERPGAVTVAAIAAFLFGAGNVVLWALGVEVDGRRPEAGGTFVFAGLMFAMAYGLWIAKYWAVLGFQALLTLILIVAFLVLLTATSIGRALIVVAILVLGGWLFWKLVRAMARLQMPVR